MMMKSVLLLAVLAVAANAGLLSSQRNHFANSLHALSEDKPTTRCVDIKTSISALDTKFSRLVKPTVLSQFKAVIDDLQSCLDDANPGLKSLLAKYKEFACDTCPEYANNLKNGEADIPGTCGKLLGDQSCTKVYLKDIEPLDLAIRTEQEKQFKCWDATPDELWQAIGSTRPVLDTTKADASYTQVQAYCATPPGKPTTYCGQVFKNGQLQGSADCDALTGEAQKKCYCQKLSNAGCCSRTMHDWAKFGSGNATVVSFATELATDMQTYCSINVATVPTCAGSSANSASSVQYAQAKLALSNVQCGQSTADLSYAVVKIVAAKTGLNLAEVSASVAAGTCACCSDVASASSRRLLTTVSPQFDVTMQASDDAALATASSSLTTAIAGGTLDVASQSGVLGSTAGVDAAKSVAPQTMTASSDLGSSAAAQSVLAVGLLVVAAMLF